MPDGLNPLRQHVKGTHPARKRRQRCRGLDALSLTHDCPARLGSFALRPMPARRERLNFSGARSPKTFCSYRKPILSRQELQEFAEHGRRVEIWALAKIVKKPIWKDTFIIYYFEALLDKFIPRIGELNEFMQIGFIWCGFKHVRDAIDQVVVRALL